MWGAFENGATPDTSGSQSSSILRGKVHKAGAHNVRMTWRVRAGYVSAQREDRRNVYGPANLLSVWQGPAIRSCTSLSNASASAWSFFKKAL